MESNRRSDEAAVIINLGDDSFFRSFATSTTAHGFSRLAEAQSLIRKIIWAVLLISAFIGVVSVLGIRLNMFLEYNTITESNRKPQPYMEFPSVTICNQNMVSKGKLLAKLMSETGDGGIGGGEYVVGGGGGGGEGPSSVIAGPLVDPQIEFYNRICQSTECAEEEINCATGGTGCCISEQMICDGYTDCMDQSDESDCFFTTDGWVADFTTFYRIRTTQYPWDDVNMTNDTTTLRPHNTTTWQDDKTSQMQDPSNFNNHSMDTMRRRAVGVGNEWNSSSHTGPSTTHSYLQNTTYATDYAGHADTRSEDRSSKLDFIHAMREDGWQLHDRSSENETTTLLDCWYSGTRCDAKWFLQVLTEKGSCYTFNHPQRSLPSSLDTPLRQTTKGPGFGLQLVLDARTADYMTNVYTNMYKGLIVRVHDRQHKPQMKDEGTYVPVGFHTNIAISKIQLLNIEEPWGKCNREERLQLSPSKNYTYEACSQECIVRQIVEVCGCKPFFSDIEDDSIETCDVTTWMTCGTIVQHKTSRNFSEVCSPCAPSCVETDYGTKISQTQIISSIDDWIALNTKYYRRDKPGDHTNNPSFYSESVVSLSIYFEDLQLTTITQKKEIDELGLISEFGGMLGLFMGLSLLTLAEIIEAIVMAFYMCYFRRAIAKDRSRCGSPSLPLTTSDIESKI